MVAYQASLGILPTNCIYSRNGCALFGSSIRLLAKYCPFSNPIFQIESLLQHQCTAYTKFLVRQKVVECCAALLSLYRDRMGRTHSSSVLSLLVTTAIKVCPHISDSFSLMIVGTNRYFLFGCVSWLFPISHYANSC
jgi:hypothetical protein